MASCWRQHASSYIILQRAKISCFCVLNISVRKDAFFSCRKVWCCSLFRGKVSTGKHLTFVCRAGPSQCKYICENQAHTKDRANMEKPVTCTSSSSFLWEGQLFGTALGSFPKVTEPEHTGWITEKAQGHWSIQSIHGEYTSTKYRMDSQTNSGGHRNISVIPCVFCRPSPGAWQQEGALCNGLRSKQWAVLR